MTLIAPKRGESAVSSDGRTSLRLQKFLEDIADAVNASSSTAGFNAPITPGTFTKITYDANGLVTSGSDATTSDIGEGANLYFTPTRMSDVIVDGTHLTWTFDLIAGTLTGDVLVTLQDAYDAGLGAVNPNESIILVGAGDGCLVYMASSTAYFQVSDSSNTYIATFDESGVHCGISYATSVFDFQSLLNSETVLNYSNSTRILKTEVYFQALNRVETSNDYLTVGT